jgi:hypothetical protein
MTILETLKRLWKRPAPVAPEPAAPTSGTKFIPLDDPEAPYNPGTTPSGPRDDGT